jgi:WhiB family redox-sensing transcriptional regulator
MFNALVELFDLGHDPDTMWMAYAICPEVDPEIFFPETRGSQDGILAVHSGRYARQVCRTCPVQPECLAYALERPELRGVWGGTTEQQRDEMLALRLAA